MRSAADLLMTVRGEDEDSQAWRALRALAGDMDAAGRNRDDPTREVFGLLGDRWSMLVLLILGAGDWRHATLRRIISALASEGSISQRMLTLKLRALERDGFVRRDVSGDVPPQVVYSLTDVGRQLLEEASRLLDWIKGHRMAIASARRDFDARTGGE